MKQEDDLVFTYAKLKSLCVKPNAKEKFILSRFNPLTYRDAQFPEEYGKEVSIVAALKLWETWLESGKVGINIVRVPRPGFL